MAGRGLSLARAAGKAPAATAAAYDAINRGVAAGHRCERPFCRREGRCRAQRRTWHLVVCRAHGDIATLTGKKSFSRILSVDRRGKRHLMVREASHIIIERHCFGIRHCGIARASSMAEVAGWPAHRACDGDPSVRWCGAVARARGHAARASRGVRTVRRCRLPRGGCRCACYDDMLDAVKGNGLLPSGDGRVATNGEVPAKWGCARATHGGGLRSRLETCRVPSAPPTAWGSNPVPNNVTRSRRRHRLGDVNSLGARAEGRQRRTCGVWGEGKTVTGGQTACAQGVWAARCEVVWPWCSVARVRWRGVWCEVAQSHIAAGGEDHGA